MASNEWHRDRVNELQIKKTDFHGDNQYILPIMIGAISILIVLLIYELSQELTLLIWAAIIFTSSSILILLILLQRFYNKIINEQRVYNECIKHNYDVILGRKK